MDLCPWDVVTSWVDHPGLLRGCESARARSPKEHPDRDAPQREARTTCVVGRVTALVVAQSVETPAARNAGRRSAAGAGRRSAAGAGETASRPTSPTGSHPDVHGRARHGHQMVELPRSKGISGAREYCPTREVKVARKAVEALVRGRAQLRTIRQGGRPPSTALPARPSGRSSSPRRTPVGAIPRAIRRSHGSSSRPGRPGRASPRRRVFAARKAETGTNLALRRRLADPTSLRRNAAY